MYGRSVSQRDLTNDRRNKAREEKYVYSNVL